MKANPSIISSYIFKFASALHCKRFINKHDYLQLPPLKEGTYFPYFSFPEGWSEIIPERNNRQFIDYLLHNDVIKGDGSLPQMIDSKSIVEAYPENLIV